MEFLSNIANGRTWNKHSVKLVWIVVALFFIYVLASIIWNVWSQSKIKQANYQPQNIPSIVRNTQPSYRVSDIVNANLFGDPTPAPAVTIAPKTTLDLTLEGVLWSSNNTVGRAIIMVGKKSAELYSVGEEIEGAGAEIDEIRDAEVILNRNGVLESLPLIKLTSSGNRELVTFVSEPIPGMDDHFFDDHSIDDHSVEMDDAAQEEIRQATPAQPTSTTDGTRRVRRPNFSGLDRALEKMGEL